MWFKMAVFPEQFKKMSVIGYRQQLHSIGHEIASTMIQMNVLIVKLMKSMLFKANIT